MTDRELKENVQNALDWEPSVDQRDIGSIAERVAPRVYGVKAVANDLEARLASDYDRTDNAPTLTSPRRL